MRLAYLCNLYPAVSHSFIRREIEGVEAAGHEVHRFSLRPPPKDLKDQADLREQELTKAALSQGLIKLGLACTGLALTRPFKSLNALRTAQSLSPPGLSNRLRHFAYWLEAGWLLRRMEQAGIEHLHAHFGTNPAAVAAIARAWGGPPFSFTAHGPDEFDAPVALSLHKKIAAASFVVAISSFGRSQLMRWCGIDQWSKLKVIRCGLDEHFLDAPVVPPPRGSVEFVCVARLSAQKGLPLLIAAADRLKARGDQFHVMIIGDGELRGQMEEEIGRRALADHVTLAGVRSSEEIRQHLSAARAFVLPSFAEGLPVVLMEALAMSRPVITTAVAGNPELVNDKCGWLIPAGSEEALADAMSQVLKSEPEELEAKGAVGRERAHQMHNATRNAASIVEAITTVASRSPAAGAS